jgi:hypothetical protein
MAFLVRQGDYASALQIYSYVGNTDEVARVRISLRIEDLATKDVDVFGQKCFFFSSQFAHGDVTKENDQNGGDLTNNKRVSSSMGKR